MMLAIVDIKKPMYSRLSDRAKLFFCRLENKHKENRISELQAAYKATTEALKDIRVLYSELQNDRDVLDTIGVKRREDGAWVFHFDILLKNLDEEDLMNLRTASDQVRLNSARRSVNRLVSDSEQAA